MSVKPGQAQLTSPTVESLPGPIDRRLQLGAGPNNRPVHRIIRWVAALNFLDALLQGHGLPGWTGGHVGEAEGVHHRAILDREGGQLLDQVALLGLKARPRVMGDKAGQPLLTLPAKEPGAIHGMEAEPIQRRSVANVMQERGRDQQIGFVGRQDCGHAPRLVSDCLNMSPAVVQGCDQPFCLRLCPHLQGHDATIPCPLDRAQAVLLAA
jgi:hypothetical protein